MSDEARYAVLIDAENVSSKYIHVIFDEASNYGISTYRRIYGDWTSTRNNQWKDLLLNNSISPIQQYSYTNGKNSSDSALIIDAMDILYTGSVDGFVLVSSDSDFTRLASRLRESGMNVIGMGETKTPNAFISACNVFKYLDVLYAASPAEEEKEEKEPAGSAALLVSNPKTSKNAHPRPKRIEAAHSATKISTIRRALRQIVLENSDDDDWISLANLGNQLAKRFPDFDVRNYGHQKLATFVESFQDFDVEQRAVNAYGSKQLYVRFKK
ncbi:MAG: NYN domain-containing protein [Peptoniphilaceae bacterium]|nr:NYN domain-containing protein [Peptoniphilaceae bacterium]MDY4196147.1 NYN domain-containing protein [Peptoniphilaceae bacterium]MDY5842620.1 NYN domain-containing protein [Peptoniphilaceae bacterium]MDY6146748.1 NYN domain-containing protein [Peptoniphilaceae bacterium]